MLAPMKIATMFRRASAPLLLLSAALPLAGCTSSGNFVNLPPKDPPGTPVYPYPDLSKPASGAPPYVVRHETPKPLTPAQETEAMLRPVGVFGHVPGSPTATQIWNRERFWPNTRRPLPEDPRLLTPEEVKRREADLKNAGLRARSRRPPPR